MATITTDFNLPSVSRSRADRSSAGVVAGYIRELASAPASTQVRARSAVSTARSTVSAAADAVGASAYISAARARSGDGSPRLGSSRARGGCGARAKRMLESR